MEIMEISKGAVDASFWKNKYNTKDGKGKVKDFLDKAKAHY